MIFLRSFLSRLRLFFFYQPIRLRGALAFILSVLILKFFAFDKDDLIAYMIGGGIVGLLLFAALCLPLAFFILRRSLSIQTILPSTDCLSRRELPAGFFLTGLRLVPFYSLRLERVFAHQGVLSPIHILSGLISKRQILDSISFPHRGAWMLRALQLSLEDALGFFRLRWSYPLSALVEVHAQRLPIKALPLAVSSAHPGDQITHNIERTGDYFDLKPYDPSDGISRILWKVYARSGQLVVRRPEPALLPEGEVALYLVARRDDDHVAGALRSYLDELQRRSIIVLFGSDGLEDSLFAQHHPSAQGSHADDQPHGFVKSQAAIEHAMTHLVWHEAAGSGSAFSAYLQSLEKEKRLLQEVVVFVSADNTECYLQLLSTARNYGIRLSLVLVAEKLFSPTAEALRWKRRTSGRSLLPWAQPRSAQGEREKNFRALVEQSGERLIICERLSP